MAVGYRCSIPPYFFCFPPRFRAFRKIAGRFANWFPRSFSYRSAICTSSWARWHRQMTLLNHFVFIAQVGKTCCLRSNNICLFLLPCPRNCLHVLYKLGMLPKDVLFLCGDIEKNSGPSEVETILEKLDISADFKEIKLSQVETRSRLEIIELPIKSLEGRKPWQGKTTWFNCCITRV